MKLTTSYMTNSDCYKSNRQIKVKGLMIHSVGCPQPKAQAFINNWNKPNANAAVHGFIQPDGEVFITLPCMVTSGTAMRGWHGGGASNNSYLGFEMTEPNTIKYVGGATWVDNNPEVTKSHVMNTYKYAVELFAALCKFHKLNPLEDGVIISHSEGCKMGIASNHGDTEHIWKKFGLSMKQFRQDIKNAMEDEEDMTQEKFNELMNVYLTQLAEKEPSEWSKDAREWAESSGIINGDSNGNKMYKKFTTREELAQILYRMK